MIQITPKSIDILLNDPWKIDSWVHLVGCFFFQVCSKNRRAIWWEKQISSCRQLPRDRRGIAGRLFFVHWKHHWPFCFKVEHKPHHFIRDLLQFIHVKSMTGSLCGDGATFELHNFRSWRAAESLGTSGETLVIMICCLCLRTSRCRVVRRRRE